MRYSLLLLIFTWFGCETKIETPQVIELHNDWDFKNISDSLWYSAIIPGNIHSDLLKHNLIEHPFILNNEHNTQWISKTDWEYKTMFNIDKKVLQKNNIILCFEGLDTYASIYLNDNLLLNTNNAFRKFQVDVKSILTENNTLKIVFDNTTKHEEESKKQLNYSLPEGNRIFTRKAQFQYGWDWGPKINTSGIWRPVKLIAWNDTKINDVYIEQNELNESIAKLTVHIDCSNSNTEQYTFEIFVNDTLISKTTDNFNNKSLAIPIEIENPKRWWPHNVGDPYLYGIKIIIKKDDTIIDEAFVKKGLRTIELVTEKDESGESFYFKINDVPIYVKGANYIPQNSLQNMVTTTHYEKLLDDVVAANMNTLRVWGGGIYENDIFDDLCDEKGLLVWQDFMFACAMYPGDIAYLKNVQQEAIDNVKRLRNHASIGLWCGNNESSEGWYRWGWQADRSETEKEIIWNNYLKIFDSILPNTISNLTDTNYWESSPKYGRGNPKYQFEGDAHDWWIWHDAYPFEHLEKQVPRFMSEFGMQSFPSYEVIRHINQNDSLNLTSKGLRNHQKHHRGFELINTYMLRDFPVPSLEEDYIYMSQLVQAYGITKGIEAQRRAKPYNMGTLFWQLNDCWPSISWSSIDFFGNWKALHYKVKKVFKNILVSSRVEGNLLKTFVINDRLNSVPLELKLELIDFEGNKLWDNFKNIDCGGISNTQINSLNLNQLNFDHTNAIFVVSNTTNRWLHYFTNPKNLKLHKEEINKQIIKTSSGFTILLSSSTLQKDVFLYTQNKGHFSDNFLDLLPNETIKIHFKTTSETLEDLSIKTLNQFLY